MCGDDTKETELGVAVTAQPLLFLIAWVFIMKMQFHSISCLALPTLAVFNMTKGFFHARGSAHPSQPLIVNE